MRHKYRDRFGVLRDERAQYLQWLYEQGQRGGDKVSRRDFLKLATATAAAGIGAFHLRQYADLPGIMSHVTGPAQMKNSMAAVTAGIIGQMLHGGDSHIDLKVKKGLWPDARVIGDTTPDSIDTNIKLRFTSVHFTGQKSQDGLLGGKIEKSGREWKITQLSEGEYKITGPHKCDDTLTIAVNDGKISGKFTRGSRKEGRIQGTYDSEGNVKFKIAYPPLEGLTTVLEGKITKK